MFCFKIVPNSLVNVCTEAIEDEQGGSIEEGQGSCTPNFRTPDSHSSSIHPSFVMAVDNYTSWQVYVKTFGSNTGKPFYWLVGLKINFETMKPPQLKSYQFFF